MADLSKNVNDKEDAMPSSILLDTSPTVLRPDNYFSFQATTYGKRAPNDHSGHQHLAGKIHRANPSSATTHAVQVPLPKGAEPRLLPETVSSHLHEDESFDLGGSRAFGRVLV